MSVAGKHRRRITTKNTYTNDLFAKWQDKEVGPAEKPRLHELISVMGVKSCKVCGIRASIAGELCKGRVRLFSDRYQELAGWSS